MTKNDYQQALTQYVSASAAEMLANLFFDEKALQLVVTRPRNSKFGDYRPPQARQPFHKITINANLEANSFFITLLHEYAHYLIWLTHQNKVAPHGTEWKSTFRMLLRQAIDAGCFSGDVKRAVIQSYFEREQIARGIGTELKKATGQLQNQVFIADLPAGACFVLSGRTFKKGRKLRTRYECTELSSGRVFRVHPEAVPERLINLK